MSVPVFQRRVFIPQVTPWIRRETILHLCGFTDYIGFNYFDLASNFGYKAMKERGLRDYYSIPEHVKIFLATTREDEYLERFFRKYGTSKMVSDFEAFRPDLAQGPDWYVYEDDPPRVREKCINRAFRMNLNFVDLDYVLPNIHASNYGEAEAFIRPFRLIGKSCFCLAGRGRLTYLGNKVAHRRRFSSLTSNLVKNEGIELLVTGCNSPRLMRDNPLVSGFSGLGWLIQSRQRRLIMGHRYYPIMNPSFRCDDPDCCGGLEKSELMDGSHEVNRYIHNLKRLSESLGVSGVVQGGMVFG